MWLAGVLAGCGTISASVTTLPLDSGDPDEPTTTPVVDDRTPMELDFPKGVSLAKVSAYQGVESILVKDGEVPSRPQVPLAAGRKTLIRVFLEVKPAFEPREIGVYLVVTNGRREEVIDRTPFVRTDSTDEDYESTVNFVLDADQIEVGTELRVELHELDPDAPGGGDRSDAVWKGTELDIAETGVVTIAIQPVRYRADGSNRLPDTSESQLQRIEDQMLAMYPARKIKVRVDRAFDWDRTIQPFSSSDWSRILQQVAVMRARATDEDPNTYYYGMFEPAVSEAAYCRQGCILGLSLLAQTANDPYYRSSVGLGYSGQNTVDTLVHEVGHAHGREHAPCGLGGQSSDRNYPYAGADIGVWGWDARDGDLIDPTRTVDMMSYCAPIWLSDYTFAALYDRIQAVERSPRAATVERPMFAWDPVEDTFEPLGDATLLATTVGEAVRVRIVRRDGAEATVGGQWYRFGDLPGGFVALDARLPAGAQAIGVE